MRLKAKAKAIRISHAKFHCNSHNCTRYSRLRESHFWDTVYRHSFKTLQTVP